MTNLDYAAHMRALAKENELYGKHTYNQMDCIHAVLSPLNQKCSGTNWLWRSIKNSPKYKYLIDRDYTYNQRTFTNGDLVFKISDDQIPAGYADRPNCYHVGVVVDAQNGLVVHSTTSNLPGKDYNGVREDASLLSGAWNGWGVLKFLDYTDQGSIPVQPDFDTTVDKPVDTVQKTDLDLLSDILEELRKITLLVSPD